MASVTLSHQDQIEDRLTGRSILRDCGAVPLFSANTCANFGYGTRQQPLTRSVTHPVFDPTSKHLEVSNATQQHPTACSGVRTKNCAEAFHEAGLAPGWGVSASALQTNHADWERPGRSSMAHRVSLGEALRKVPSRSATCRVGLAPAERQTTAVDRTSPCGDSAPLAEDYGMVLRSRARAETVAVSLCIPSSL